MVLSSYLAAALAAAATSAPAVPAAAPPTTSAHVGNAFARTTGTTAVLADDQITHRWSITKAGVLTTTALTDDATHLNHSAPGSNEFSLLLDSVPTTSSDEWKLIGASAQRIPPDPSRPQRGPGVQIVFRFTLTTTSLLELDRTWTLYPSSAVQAVSETITNRSPATFRIGKYSLAELTPPQSQANATATVETFHGGSDWRQDFRVSSTERGAFDDEGEIEQLPGYFLVSDRRSGAISRAGRDSTGRAWIGVDNARDVLDAGPILSNPPAYNRIENPAYPSPIRQRTLTPGETLNLGRAFLGVYHGPAQQAPAALVPDLSAHEMPAFARSVDLNSFHPWEHGPGMSDKNLRPQARIFKSLGGEVFMLDDQWQGKSAGDWNWDTSRFPIPPGKSIPAFVTYLHKLGLSLGLWMSPAEFNPSSSAYKQHPTWACTPTGHATATVPDDSGLGVWDMNNPALRAHMTQVIDRLIAQDGVREFKFDYVVWVDCPPHDYLDYEDAYAAWVRQLEARHPGVTFELDETNDQRLWPLRSILLGPSWFDNGHLQGSTYPSRLLHDLYSAAPWLPTSTLGFGTYDSTPMPPYSPNYLIPISLLGHFTFWSDLTKLTTRERAQTRWWIEWYKRHRAALSGFSYEDTSSDPIDGTSWLALQPWQHGRGYLFVFRQKGTSSRQRIALQGLDPHKRYRLTNVRTGRRLGVFTAVQLTRGLLITEPRVYSAVVLAIDPAPKQGRRCVKSPARRSARRCRGRRTASEGAAPHRESSG